MTTFPSVLLVLGVLASLVGVVMLEHRQRLIIDYIKLDRQSKKTRKLAFRDTPTPLTPRPCSRMTTQVPVPFTDRYPGPEDCSTNAEFWVFCPGIGFNDCWELMQDGSQNLDCREEYGLTHWLPYNSIPCPAKNELA